MNAEQQHLYKTKVEIAHLDADGYIQPSGYQHIIGKVVDEHLEVFKVDFNSCLQKNLGWVIVSSHFEIKKRVQGCINLQLRTWHSERKRIYFRREIEARDDSGNMVFVASLYSVLMDFNTRTVYRKAELPFEIIEPHPEFTLDATPIFKEKLEYTKNCEREILRSFIDAFGHVNNCRYGEFAFDALPDAYADLSKLNAFSIYFCSELKLNDMLAIENNFEDNIVLHGYNKSTQKTSFYCVLFMENNS